jgi:hypothetical protein
MVRWPTLKSLKVHYLHPESSAYGDLRCDPIACTLTQLTINDKDLVYLFASSARTLERVVLDRIEGVTNNGLFASKTANFGGWTPAM